MFKHLFDPRALHVVMLLYKRMTYEALGAIFSLIGHKSYLFVMMAISLVNVIDFTQYQDTSLLCIFV